MELSALISEGDRIPPRVVFSNAALGGRMAAQAFIAAVSFPRLLPAVAKCPSNLLLFSCNLELVIFPVNDLGLFFPDPDSVVPKPVISGDNHAVMNTMFTLTCKVYHEHKGALDIKWFDPRNEVVSNVRLDFIIQ